MANPTFLSVRMDPEVAAALNRAAADDQRNVSSMVRSVLVQWLTDRRLLEPRPVPSQFKRPRKVPTNIDPTVQALLREINNQQISDAAFEVKSGISLYSLRNWRNGTSPMVHLLRASLETVGLTLKVIPSVPSHTMVEWLPVDRSARERGAPPYDGKSYLLWWNERQPDPGGVVRIGHWWGDAGGLYGPRWQETEGDHSAEDAVVTHYAMSIAGPRS